MVAAAEEHRGARKKQCRRSPCEVLASWPNCCRAIRKPKDRSGEKHAYTQEDPANQDPIGGRGSPAARNSGEQRATGGGAGQDTVKGSRKRHRKRRGRSGRDGDCGRVRGAGSESWHLRT